MAKIELPAHVEEVFYHFRTCEFSTLAKDGNPITWPISALYQPEHPRFLMTTSIGAPAKVFNLRRNPKVSLLFSDPTGSGLERPPIVLVQGDAEAPDKVHTRLNAVDGLGAYWREVIFSRQPSSRVYSRNALMRWLTDWYYMRLVIYTYPRRILWWPQGNHGQIPEQVEVSYVV